MTRETPERPAPRATALCVVCESYADEGTFPRLAGARAQMEEIAGRLEELGFEVRVVGGGDPGRADFDRAVEEWSEEWRREGGRGPALILWSGHGVLVDEELRLALSDLVPGDHPGTRTARIRRQGVSVEELVDYAVSSEADQILVLVDACYSGDGAGQSVQTALKHWSEVSLPPGRAKWLGFMASCQRNETSAGDGPLFQALARVLREGPRTDAYLSAWSAHNELVTGADLLAALPTRWEGDGQRPVRAAVGDESRAFPNPLAEPGAPPALVEHLVLAARGVGHREEGWFFTGRRRVLGRIVAWMEEGTPGLFLVTGPAGSGKSAVLGRIATLADPVRRAEAEEQGALREGDPDPGARDRQSFAAVHLRGLNALQAAAELAERLGLRQPRSVDDFRAELRELPGLPVIVLDGLDEVPSEHTQAVIEDLVFPLSRMTPVLAGSRKRPFRSKLAKGESLPDALVRHVGAGVITVDLEQEPDTREDIAGYVRKRCEAEGVDGTEVAWALASRATEKDGGFLFARLVTGFLISEIRRRGDAEGIDSGALLARLPDSVEAAFEEDLRSGPARVRDDGAVLPSAARDLLTALAWAAGRGMPAGGVWEAAASALGGRTGDAGYDEGDVDWVLAEYGRYIVEDSEGSQAVYRLYHREFVSHLRRRKQPERGIAGLVVLRALVALLKDRAEPGDWEAVDPYVRKRLATHAVWAGGPGPGIDVLRELVEWDADNASPHLASALHDCAIDLGMNGEREAAVELSREAAEMYSELADGDAGTYLPHFAMALNTLAIRLGEAGDRQGALEPAREAVRIYTDLARINEAAHLPHLATALNTLGYHLGEAGDRHAALEAAQETVRIYTDLARTNEAVYLPDLAMALNNLANHLAETGDRQGALEPAHEAVRIYAHLTGTNPAAFLPNLASSLSNLANHLAVTGDLRAALRPAHDAVRIYTHLVGINQAAFRPDLAATLNNLASHLSETGDLRAALEPAHEAVRIYTDLARTNEALYLPDLAMALNNLANRLAETGDRQAALEPAHEAVRIYSNLARTNEAAYLPDLAMALNNLANRLAETGDLRAALDSAQEAVRIRRSLAEADRAAYLPNLAGSLSNLAIRLSQSGDRQAALEPAREAVHIRRALADADPAAYLPSLAMALNNLASHLAESGDRQAGLEYAREAVGIYADLAAADESAFLPRFGGSLTNLANHLAGTGDSQAALEPAHEAVRIFTRLADTDEAAYLPDLATALNNLAIRLAETEDGQAALDAARKAVRIRRALAEADPAAHLPDLAIALNNLSGHLADTGDMQAAPETAREAVLIYTELVDANEAAYLPKLLTALNNLANHLTAAGDESAAILAYAETAACLAGEHPAAQRGVDYEGAVFQLSRPAPTSEAGLRGLVRLLGGDPAHGDAISYRARTELRAWAAESEQSRTLVERIWSEETGDAPVPAWLSLSQETLTLTEAWLLTPDWVESRDFWLRHVDALSADAVATALEELALVSPVAQEHHRLRQLILSHGAAPVFHGLILGERLGRWLRCESWDDSRRFLQENADVLLDESAEEYFEVFTSTDPRVAAHRAILSIARNEDIDAAYRCVQDRGVLQEHVAVAMNEGDADSLRHLAVIEAAVFDDVPSAAVHVQAALVLADDTESLAPDALAQATAEADPATRTRLTAELATLSTRHGGEHMAHWMSLIEALNRSA
ncbi:tetratricopeptide repeat protein [Streptomyces sp. NPDC052676]|uniref:tetratricopeptide repeat protein n=1 Tax=Streptomyces sp. NPDC052676 TaxID=3154953 RepID=UPI00343ABA0A